MEYFFSFERWVLSALQHVAWPALTCPALVNPNPDEKEIGLLFEAFNVPGICTVAFFAG